MNRQDAVSSASALVVLAAIIVIGCSVVACGTSANRSAAATCRVGSAVGAPPRGHALPSCTSTEPRGSTYNYPCRASGSDSSTSDFYLVYLPKAVLYGKPDGVWHRAAANAPFGMLRNKLDC